MLKKLSTKDWNYETAAHLLNRAGFGGNPAQIEALRRRGLAGAVNHLLAFSNRTVPRPAFVKPGVEKKPDRKRFKKLSPEQRKKIRKAERLKNRSQLQELRVWWMQQMLAGRYPLREKLTLFWHGHFATSFRKVKSSYAMYLQNQTFRKNAAGNFENLVTAIIRDPAMLHYLDNHRNFRGKPNENMARELMELFTLGEGNYSEEDIRNSARALTGWSIAKDKVAFQFNQRRHDAGQKIFFNESGNFSGDDIVRIILKQPATSDFISKKIWTFFAYENPSHSLTKKLAESFRKNKLEIKPLLREIFMSQEFYGKRSHRTQIKGPVHFLVQTTKQLETKLPEPKISQNVLRLLGQELFAPPNVKGWDGGFSWISASTINDRRSLVHFLVAGTKNRKRKQSRAPIAKFINKWDHKNAAALCQKLQIRFFQSGLRVTDRNAFDLAATNALSGSEQALQALILQMLYHPQYQLT